MSPPKTRANEVRHHCKINQSHGGDGKELYNLFSRSAYFKVVIAKSALQCVTEIRMLTFLLSPIFVSL